MKFKKFFGLIFIFITISTLVSCGEYSKYPYTITWLDYDGTVLEEKTYKTGEVPIYTGEIPTREGTDYYEFVFKGWSPATSIVQGNHQVYTADYYLVELPQTNE